MNLTQMTIISTIAGKNPLEEMDLLFVDVSHGAQPRIRVDKSVDF